MTGADRLLPTRVCEHLRTRRFGRRVYYYPETDSTNRAALALARCGESAGTVVMADFQTKGRGRLDHDWSSRDGEDLLFSVILRPGAPPAGLLPATLVFSSALAAELSVRLGEAVSVKWPNDMMVRGGKIGGVLAEGALGPVGDPYLVVGVGLNVNSLPGVFPAHLRGRVATCRAVSGRSWDRAELLANVLESMERDYDTFEAAGFAGLRTRYEGRLSLLGRKVRFARDGRDVVALVDGVDDDGALRVVPEGEIRPVSLYGEHVEPVA